MVKERMDLLELLRKGGMDGDVDFLREALRVVVEGIMDAEVSSRIGAWPILTRRELFATAGRSRTVSTVSRCVQSSSDLLRSSDRGSALFLQRSPRRSASRRWECYSPRSRTRWRRRGQSSGRWSRRLRFGRTTSASFNTSRRLWTWRGRLPARRRTRTFPRPRRSSSGRERSSAMRRVTCRSGSNRLSSSSSLRGLCLPSVVEVAALSRRHRLERPSAKLERPRRVSSRF